MLPCATTSKQPNVHFNCSILQGTLLIKIYFTGINGAFIFFFPFGVLFGSLFLCYATQLNKYLLTDVDSSPFTCFHTHILENYAGILLQESESTEIPPEILLYHRAGLHNPCAVQEFQALWIWEQWNIRISGTL